jgi:hypothetical protein
MKHLFILDDETAMAEARELAALTGESVQAVTSRALRAGLAAERDRRRAGADRAVWRALHPCHLGPSSALLARD